MVGIMSSFLCLTFIPEFLQSVLIIAAEKLRKVINTLSKNSYLLMDSWQVLSIFLSPAFIPEDLELVLAIAAKCSKVNKQSDNIIRLTHFKQVLFPKAGLTQ